MSRTTLPCPHPPLPSASDTGLGPAPCSTASTSLQPLGREAFGLQHNQPAVPHHISTWQPRGGSQPGQGSAVPPAHLAGDASPHSGSTHVEEDSVAGCFKPISKRLAAPPWGVYFQALSTFIQPAFCCFALGFLQLQATSAPPARASSLIPRHTNDARGGNESRGLSRTWFP